MSSIQVDPQKLLQAGTELGVAADILEKAWKQFIAEAKALGAPWGDDDIGRKWAAIYVPALADCDDRIVNIILKAMRARAAELHNQGLLYNATEEANLS